MVHAAGDTKVPESTTLNQMKYISKASAQSPYSLKRGCGPILQIFQKHANQIDELEGRGFQMVSRFSLYCLLEPDTAANGDEVDIFKTAHGWVANRYIYGLGWSHRLISRTDRGAEEVLMGMKQPIDILQGEWRGWGILRFVETV